MNKHKFTLIYISVLIPFLVIGQNPTLKIDSINACLGSEILVPVVLENSSETGALSLEISYDPASLHFIQFENVHEYFETVKYHHISEPSSKILISWFDCQGVVIDSAKIFDLKFSYTNSSSFLNFDSKCEIASSGLSIMNVEYVNGSVGPSISITAQPTSSTITPPGGTDFSVESYGGDQFQWQQSHDGLVFSDLVEDDIFTGVNTANLSITETDMSMDSTFYRCLISNDGCDLVSEIASLNFEGTKYQQIILKEGWSSLSSYVVPLDDNIESVLESISNSLEYLFNNEGYFNPQTGTNTFEQFDPKAGYAIKLSQTDTLFIAGLKMDSTQLTIPEGWSYLPVLSDCNITVSDLFGAAISDVIIIKEIAGNNVFWPEKGINTLTILETGKSYLLKTAADFDLNFPECDQ